MRGLYIVEQLELYINAVKPKVESSYEHENADTRPQETAEHALSINSVLTSTHLPNLVSNKYFATSCTIRQPLLTLAM